MIKRKKSLILIIGMLVCLLVGQIGIPFQVSAKQEEQISLLRKYDSADTAAIKAIDTENDTISFRNKDTGRDYTLSYDNTSLMYNQYGRALSPKLLELGTIVDITFLKNSRHLNSLVISSAAWVHNGTKDYVFSESDETAEIGGTAYHLGNNALILAEKEPVILADILPGDTVRISGIGQEVYSICVTNGHGYVSLSTDEIGDQSLAGAWLELGNTVIHRISDNMLINAPEGVYTLHILGNGADYTKQITVARNKETVIDASDITLAEPSRGDVIFQTDPEEAKIYVDGIEALTGVSYQYDYGFHALKVSAQGYETIEKYLRVGQPSAVVQIDLEKAGTVSSNSSIAKSASAASVASSSAGTAKTATAAVANTAKSSGTRYTVSGNSSGSSVTESSNTGNEVTGYKVYVDAPVSAELYMDGSYIGVVPANFTKVSGTHTITLKKTGYTTRSYSISIDSAKCDKTYSFPDLIRETDVSGNTTG